MYRGDKDLDPEPDGDLDDSPGDSISNQPPTKRARIDAMSYRSVRDIVTSEEQRFIAIQESECDCLGCVSYMNYHKKLLKWLDGAVVGPEPEDTRDTLEPEEQEVIVVKDEEEEEEPPRTYSPPPKRMVVNCCMCPAHLCEGTGFTNHLCKHLEGKTCERPGPVHTPKQHSTLRYVFEHIVCTKELGKSRTGIKVERFDNVRIADDNVHVYGTCGRDPEILLGKLAKAPQRTASWTLESINRQLHN